MRNDFDLIAPVYDLLARCAFGTGLEKAQLVYLAHIPDNGKILIIGGGSGYILREVLKLKPEATIDYVEASHKMLELSQREVSGSVVRFIHGTQEDIPEEDYDCVITNFFLDVFSSEELISVVSLLKSKLGSGAIWLCTDFGKTDRWNHKLILWVMHRFFQLVSGLTSKDLQDIDRAITRAGLVKTQERRFRKGLIFSALYKLSE